MVEAPREDCDTVADASLGSGLQCGPASDPVRGCRYLCADDISCPGGWACGSDGVCRHPTATYESASAGPVELSGDYLGLGDFDGDQRQDVAGFAGDRISIRFGGDQLLAEPLEFAMTLTGLPAIRDLDLDGIDDIAAPIPGGQLSILLGQRNRTLAPVPSAQLEPAGSARFRLRAIKVRPDHPADGFLFFLEDAGRVLALVRDFDQQDVSSPAYTFGAQNLDDLCPYLPVADVDDDGIDDIVLALAGRTDMPILSPSCTDACAPVELFAAASVELPAPLLEGAMNADVDGDGVTDILASVDASGTERVAVSFGDRFGGFSPAIIDDRFDALLFVADEAVPAEYGSRWPRATGDLNGDGRADFVGAHGIYVSSGTKLTHRATIQTWIGWTEAVVADLNRDGALDVAALTRGVRGIDVFLGDGAGWFSPARIETDAAVERLRTGDFDGDRVQDLAFVLGSADDQEAAVAFGQIDGPPESPISMGRLGGITALEPAKLYPGALYFDVTDDLIVITESPAQSIAFLTGARERRMLSPLFLDLPEEALASSVSVVTGSFQPNASKAPPDIVVSDALGMTMIAGTPNAQYSTLRRLQDDFPCAGGWEPLCAQTFVTEADGDETSQELVSISGSLDCANASSRMRIATSLFGGAPRCVEVAVDLEGPAQPFSFDSGTAILFARSQKIAITKSFQLQPNGSFAWDSVFDAKDGIAATAVQADRDVEPEIAVLTTTGIDIYDGDGARVARAADFAESRGWFRIISGDLDGDGLEDLAVSDGRVLSFLRARAQEASP